jgi:hypothetical protein
VLEAYNRGTMKRALLAAIALVLVTLPLRALAQDKPADVAGVWAVQIEIGGGTTGTPTVTLKQAGEKITGTYSSQVLGERELIGTVKGNAITWEIMADFDGNKVKVVYAGTVEKDTMKGKVSFGDLGEGTFTAKKK